MTTFRKKQIAVIGSASNNLSEVQRQLAFEIGQTLVEQGCRVINGGMGGVMSHSARGAHAASTYCPGDVIGVLPSYDASDANPYIDIALPTGLGVARNAVLMASCDAVVALDGGSGTLSEIALAWQMKKPIACIGEEGWHQRLQSLTLDSRRDDAIELLADMDELAGFIERLHQQSAPGFGGIQQSQPARESLKDAPGDDSREEMARYLRASVPCVAPEAEFEYLGDGSEGVVFSDGARIFKVFHPNDYQMLLFSHLSSLSQILLAAGCDQLPLPVFTVSKGAYLVIHYSCFMSTSYGGGHAQAMVAFLQSMRAAGYCMSNVKAANFRHSATGQLVCIDIGRDVMPYSESLFVSMCKRAFLTVHFSEHPQFKALCRYTNDHDDFAGIAAVAGVDYTDEQLAQMFNGFYDEVGHAS